MDLVAFEASLSGKGPPEGIVPVLEALWFDGKGDWNRAHQIVQDIPRTSAAWVHAHLHRKEGDTWNADYWYSRAGRPRPTISLDAEWRDIVAALLGDDQK
ncbi:MAG: hypothetical protein ABFS23_06430 [Pseudomonadota bacterium]